MKLLKQLASILLILTFILSCNKNDLEVEKEYSISGYAQKGPFIIGSNVTISELNEALIPTGKVYFSTIISEDGYFEVPGVKLTSKYVQVQVIGKFFNEVYGSASRNELTLHSIFDISSKENANVNLLTHFEVERLKKLVGEGLDFETAKKQSYLELKQAYGLNTDAQVNTESLDLSAKGVDNTILLAISSLFGHIINEYSPNSYAEWLSLLTNFKTDFSDNGVIDDKIITNTVLSVSSVLDVEATIRNMQNKYTEAVIGNLSEYESLIKQIQNNENYTNYIKEVYPAEKDGYINILTLPNNTVLAKDKNYAVIVNKPSDDFKEWGIGIMIDVDDIEDRTNFSAPSSVWNHQPDYAEMGNYHADLSSAVNNQGLLIPISLSGSGKSRLHYTVGMGLLHSAPIDKTIIWE